MKNAPPLLLLLAPILLASTLLAQGTNSSRANNLPETDPVTLARNSYIEADSGSLPANNYAAPNEPALENEMLAQYSRPPGPPFRPPMRPPMGSYPRMRSGPNWGDHGALGALIGFGVGAGAGVAWGTSREPAANRAGDALLGGLLLGGLGAAVGAAIASLPPFPRRQFHRFHSGEDDYDELGSHSKPHSAKGRASSETSASKLAATRTAFADAPSVP
jgi:hypothetical protein